MHAAPRPILVPALLCLGMVAQTAAPVAAQGLALPGSLTRAAGPAAAATSAGAQSAWVKGYNSTARLIAGAEPAGAGQRLVAGVEIRLADGWKTYWRHPGDDGGLPPAFDWSGSRNLKAARVLYPSPERIKSLNGTSLGYAKAVLFPVEVEAVDPTRPVELALALEYGICREICVPAEARLELVLAPTLASMPAELARAIARVPRLVEGAAATEVLRAAKAVLTGRTPSLTFDIAAGAGAGAGTPDLLVEAVDGAYLPLAVRIGEPAGGVQRFRIDLKGVDEVAALAGKPLRLTVLAAGAGAGAGSSSELLWRIP